MSVIYKYWYHQLFLLCAFCSMVKHTVDSNWWPDTYRYTIRAWFHLAFQLSITTKPIELCLPTKFRPPPPLFAMEAGLTHVLFQIRMPWSVLFLQKSIELLIWLVVGLWKHRGAFWSTSIDFDSVKWEMMGSTVSRPNSGSDWGGFANQASPLQSPKYLV